MLAYVLGVIIGILIGAAGCYLYIDTQMFTMSKRNINPKFLEMWEKGQGYFTMAFIINPPKPDLFKPAPKKAKLTLIKE